MSEKKICRIEVGKTDGFRYIGIEPPIKPELIGALTEGLSLQPLATYPSFKPDFGPAFTEFGFDTTAVVGDEVAWTIADHFASVLRGHVYEVVVEERIVPVGFGRHLFGGRALKLG